MKKIAIITTHHYPNYGNKLQNYALQTVLQRLGFDVETISDARNWPDMRSFRANIKSILHYIIRFRTRPIHIKTTKFFVWSKRYIKYSPITISHDSDIDRLNGMYDYYVVGSDQIWNPEWPMFSNQFGFATFAKKEQKIAYAPSLGISTMLPERINEYKEYLKNWKSISCREYEGARILRDLSGADVPVVLDPTLLLTSTDWNKITKPVCESSKYMAIYMIGKLEPEYQDYVDDLAKKTTCKVINLGGSPDNEIGLSPTEFVSYIKYAKYVITDSYHACVFALQFHKPFTLFRRKQQGELDKMSRINTLFINSGWAHYLPVGDILELHNVDWLEFEKNIENMRAFSIQYLRNNLS